MFQAYMGRHLQKILVLLHLTGKASLFYGLLLCVIFYTRSPQVLLRQSAARRCYFVRVCSLCGRYDREMQPVWTTLRSHV